MNNFVTTLLQFVNNSDVHDTNYHIAYCLLTHFCDIEKMSVQDLADECFISVSTLNRFFKVYGYKKYSIFKQMVISHLDIRMSQMQYRIKLKNYKQIDSVLSSFLDESCYKTIIQESLPIIQQTCEAILKSQRIILIGSDEMISHALRFQGDFCSMNKITIKDSIYPEIFFTPKEEDFVIVLSMSGRIMDLNDNLMNKILINNPQVLMIGNKNYLSHKHLFLHIPLGIDEVLENMILDYYLQEIVYKYARDYYDY